MNVQHQIADYINQALIALSLPQASYTLEHPADESHGDFATNVAMVIFGHLKKSGENRYANPHHLAEDIVAKVPNSEIFENINIAGPGFINFTIRQTLFLQEVNAIINQGDKYGQTNLLAGQKVSVEYTDPNPFKEFHIGHLYSNIVGECIATLKEACGATVWRGDFFGDVGMHVAKSIWGLLNKFKEDGNNLAYLSDLPLKERIEYFGQAYAKGATAYKEDETVKSEMQQLNFLIFKAAQETILPQYRKDPAIDFDQYITPSQFNYDDIKELYRISRQWSIDYFETIYSRLGTKFDGYYPESLTGEYGYAMVLEGLEKGIFEKGEGGAIIFPGEKYGLHNRVFINALGLPTYETKDFGLAQAKFVDFQYDESYNVTGNEINEYFKVVLKALSLLRPDLAKKTIHIGHGMVRLPEGKMSSRTGKILRGEWLLDEAQTASLALFKHSCSLTQTEQETIAEQVGQAAVKYALLKQRIGENIAFDFNKSISFQGNSGPYLQYTHARCRSVIRKAVEQGYVVSASIESLYQNQLTTINPEELSILRWLYRYPEVVVQASQEFSPHYICTYLYELAQRFNTFYNQHSILGKDKTDITDNSVTVNQATSNSDLPLRLAITTATAQVLKNGLTLLGITAPEKM